MTTNYDAIHDNIANPPYGAPFAFYTGGVPASLSLVMILGQRRDYNLYLSGDFDGETLMAEWSVDEGSTWFPFLNNGVVATFTQAQIQFFRLLDTGVHMRLTADGAGTAPDIFAELR